jgi:uncharacterized protein YbaR (Trm112 family)
METCKGCTGEHDIKVCEANARCKQMHEEAELIAIEKDKIIQDKTKTLEYFRTQAIERETIWRTETKSYKDILKGDRIIHTTCGVEMQISKESHSLICPKCRLTFSGNDGKIWRKLSEIRRNKTRCHVEESLN